MSGSRGIRFLSRMSLPKIPTRKLNDGTHFPLIAYGTGTALVRLGAQNASRNGITDQEAEYSSSEATSTK